MQACLDNPSVNALYINRSLRQAKTNVWGRINEITRTHGLKVAINSVEQTVRFENGSTLYISGAESQADADRFRGMVCSIVAIDEAQSIPDTILDYLLKKVIPACLLVKQGPVLMTGTPNTVCFGLFYEITRDDSQKGWSVHRWTWRTNPAIRNQEAFLSDVLKANGWKETDASYLTEFGGIWVRDENVLLYRYNSRLNAWDGKLPADLEWFKILGLDVGFRDFTTFSLYAYSLKSPKLHLIESVGWPKLLPDQIGEIVSRYVNEGVVKVVMDEGSLGLSMAEQYRARGLPVEKAVKTEKMANIRFMNGDMQTGVLQVHEERCRPLIHQWSTLTITPDGGEEKTQANDFADSALYGYRHCRQYLFREPVKDTETLMHRLEREAFERTERAYNPDPFADAPQGGDWAEW